MIRRRPPRSWYLLLALFSGWHALAMAQPQPNLDPGRWYRLANAFLGEDRALELDPRAGNAPLMGRARDIPGQLWRFHPVKGGLFRITNQQAGEGLGLGVGQGEGNAPVMAPTSDPRGQLWRITPAAGGGWQLTNQVLGKGRALDTYSDGANAPFMGETGDYSGQVWSFEAQGHVRATLVAKQAGAAQQRQTSSGQMGAAEYAKLTAGQRGPAGKAPSQQGKAKPATGDKTAEQAYGRQQQASKPPAPVPHATAEQIYAVVAAHFDELVVAASQGRLVVAELGTSWCGNCQALEPVLETVVRNLGPGVALAKIDAEADGWQLYSALGFTLWGDRFYDDDFAEAGIPLVVCYQGGKVVQHFTGYLEQAEVAALLEPLVSGTAPKAAAQTANPARAEPETIVVTDAAPPADPGELEKQVIAEINLVRADPPAYARRYLVPTRSYYHQKLIEAPGRIAVETSEGVAALDECIKALLHADPAPALSHREGLALAARDHARDQERTGATGHEGSDGSTPETRSSRHGRWDVLLGENIDYGYSDARGIVSSLLIDDGVPSRGHRENLLNQTYKCIGVAVGPHPVYGYMCVMDFAGIYK